MRSHISAAHVQTSQFAAPTLFTSALRKAKAVLFIATVLACCWSMGLQTAVAQSFAAKVDYGAGTGPRSVAFGDFNLDGKPDLAVANQLSNTVSVFINNGAGTFAAKVDYPTGSLPVSVVVGDFNADGKPDLAVANFGSDTVSVFINNGAGTFAAKVDYTTGTGPYSVAVGDFNLDGKPDLAVANFNSATVSVLINNGAGTFAAKVDFTTGSGPIAVAVGDFNLDGKPDLAIANNTSNTVSVLLNTATVQAGFFGSPINNTTGTNPISVARGDFNVDGKPDLAVANYNSNTVSVFINNGAGTFAAKVDYTTGTNPISVAVGDFNLDGKPDLAVANTSSTTVSVFINNGAGTFAAKVDYTTGSAPYSVAVGDFNLDGKPDLAVANQGSNTLSVLINNGAGTFAAKVDYPTGSEPISVAVGDFNLDGKPDLAVANFSSTTVSVLINNGAGTFAAKVDYPTGSSPRSVAVGDFNLDGKPDLAVANQGSTTVSVFINNGAGTFAAKVDYPTGSAPYSVAVGDFNLDGKPDLAVANSSSSTVSVFINNGAGTFAAKVDYATGSSPFSVAVGDFNLDGKPDLAVANFSSNTVTQIINRVSAPTAADATISGSITTPDGAPLAGAVVQLSGSQTRKTITDANGNYRFDNVETSGFYTVTPARANYSFGPVSRSFSQLGNTTDAAFTGTPNSVVVGNSIDSAEYFVRQHYLDFLGREPDEAGFNFWSDQMLACGSDVACVERRTINVSAAYFLSVEFQETGGLVDGLYRASFGRAPRYAEFMPDSKTIAEGVVVGGEAWEARLAANKAAFVEAFVNRAEFHASYDRMSHDAFIDALIAQTMVSFSSAERGALVEELNTGRLTRAAALQRIAENDEFGRAKRNEMFVLMQYFGYLRRDPDADGYRFWLEKLNHFEGNFERAEMVKAFIVSGEYRQRFPK